MVAYMKNFKALLSSWRRFSEYNGGNKDCEALGVQIECYPPGYPRFSALVAADDSFHLCRRFANLRARLLLLKQDRLSVLEKQLEKIDQEETAILFLGSSRSDSNENRNSVLSEIDTVLADYDALVERNHRILNFKAAEPRDILSLQNWVDGNACLAREETAYLARCNELLSVASSDDSALAQIEAWMEDYFIRFYSGFCKNRCRGISRDPNVCIFSDSLIRRAARTLMASLILIFLLVPVVICSALASTPTRMTVITIATILFIATLSGLTKARTVETFTAGAAYATVLIVFVPGANPGTK